MSSQPLSKLERVPLREAWRHEAGEFTPWLSEPDNLDTLAQALGISELELVAVEHWVGDFKLDLLCTDGDQQVIVENQLADTDHKHLCQILTYASGAATGGDGSRAATNCKSITMSRNLYTANQIVENSLIRLIAVQELAFSSITRLIYLLCVGEPTEGVNSP
jgi:hypothetical protein